jgi:hypothetical protein
LPESLALSASSTTPGRAAPRDDLIVLAEDSDRVTGWAFVRDREYLVVSATGNDDPSARHHHIKENVMYQLDPAGRLTLTSRELSRRAAERHAHLQALDAANPSVVRPWWLRPQEWLRVMILPAPA